MRRKLVQVVITPVFAEVDDDGEIGETRSAPQPIGITGREVKAWKFPAQFTKLLKEVEAALFPVEEKKVPANRQQRRATARRKAKK